MPARPAPSGRLWLNRCIAASGLAVALAQMAVAARISPEAVRAVAGRWVRRLGRATGARFATSGEVDPLEQTMRVIVANHSSPLDVAAMFEAVPSATFVAGADLFRVPLLAGAMRAMGTIPVDRRSGTGVHLDLPAGVADESLALVVFPEGGIAPQGQRRPFHRSAFALAIEHQALIQPVAIHASDRVLPRRSWLGVRPGLVTVEFLDPIRTTGLTLDDRDGLCRRAEAQILAALEAA